VSPRPAGHTTLNYYSPVHFCYRKCRFYNFQPLYIHRPSSLKDSNSTVAPTPYLLRHKRCCHLANKLKTYFRLLLRPLLTFLNLKSSFMWRLAYDNTNFCVITNYRNNQKSFRTLSADTDCILTFSLGLSVPTLRRFCRLRSCLLRAL